MEIRVPLLTPFLSVSLVAGEELRIVADEDAQFLGASSGVLREVNGCLPWAPNGNGLLKKLTAGEELWLAADEAGVVELRTVPSEHGNG